MTAAAFGKNSVLGVQLHAQLKVVRGFAIFTYAHVASGHAFDRAIFVVEDFGGGKTREDLHAQLFGLLTQPTGHIGQANDVVAIVLEALRQCDMWNFGGASFTEHEEYVLLDWLVQWCATLFPIGEQLGERAWIHNGARQDMRTRLGAFFQHHYRNLLFFFCGELL